MDSVPAKEFQVVILAGGEGNNLYPLTDSTPKALLHVANRPLLQYQLEMLSTAGLTDILIIVNAKSEGPVRSCLASLDFISDMVIQLHCVKEDETGTADALRSARDKITCDFFVMSVDLITDLNFNRLANAHRLHGGTVTVALKRAHAADFELRKKLPQTDRSIIDYTAIDDKNRLLYMKSIGDLNDELRVRKTMLWSFPNVKFSTMLEDLHLYICSYRVLEILLENESCSTFKGEFLPLLMRSQYSNQKKFNVPRLNLSSRRAEMQSLVQEFSSRATTRDIKCGLERQTSKDVEEVQYSDWTENCILVHAHILAAEDYATRCKTILTYSLANKELSTDTDKPRPWKAPTKEEPESGSGKQFTSGCVVGNGVKISEKSSVKNSVVGNHCEIGKFVRISNSIIMDHVRILDRCSIEGSIVCNNVRMGESTSLKDCQVGDGVQMEGQTKHKGEQITPDFE